MRGCQLDEGPEEVADPGVVHEHVEPAERIVGRARDGGDGLVVEEVARHGLHAPPRLVPDRASGGGEFVRVANAVGGG